MGPSQLIPPSKPMRFMSRVRPGRRRLFRLEASVSMRRRPAVPSSLRPQARVTRMSRLPNVQMAIPPDVRRTRRPLPRGRDPQERFRARSIPSAAASRPSSSGVMSCSARCRIQDAQHARRCEGQCTRERAGVRSANEERSGARRALEQLGNRRLRDHSALIDDHELIGGTLISKQNSPTAAPSFPSRRSREGCIEAIAGFHGRGRWTVRRVQGSADHKRAPPAIASRWHTSRGRLHEANAATSTGLQFEYPSHRDR